MLDLKKSISSYRRTNRKLLGEFRPGDSIEGTFACIRKDRLLTRAGVPYLVVELRDSSATIKAHIFKQADVAAGMFEAGDIVAVTGSIRRFRNEIQADLTAIKCAQTAQPTEFLPVAYRDLDELDGFLEHLAREVHHPQYARLLNRMLGDVSLRTSWRQTPASIAGHHAYLGGLLEHTVAVATIALELCTLHPRLNSDLLLTAAILHDIGKTREFKLGATISISPEGAALGHLILGQQIISSYCDDIDQSLQLPLLHCVATHHGPDAIGADRFESAEAVTLYRLHALDVSVKAALESESFR